MTDDEEFAARSQLKWQRDGDVWILLYRRKRMGRVVPDKDLSRHVAIGQSGRFVATLPTCLGPRTPFWHRP